MAFVNNILWLFLVLIETRASGGWVPMNSIGEFFILLQLLRVTFILQPPSYAWVRKAKLMF